MAFSLYFQAPCFERPYGDLSLFSHVSGTRKLKKTCEKALKTVLATHRKKHTPRHHSWERTCPKIDPDWRSKRMPGRGHRWTIFTRVALWATHGHSNLKKHVLGMRLCEQSAKCSLLNDAKASEDVNISNFFSRWGAFL